MNEDNHKRSPKPKGRKTKWIKFEDRDKVEGYEDPDFEPNAGWVEWLSTNQQETWDSINLIEDDEVFKGQRKSFWEECCKVEKDEAWKPASRVAMAQLNIKDNKALNWDDWAC